MYNTPNIKFLADCFHFWKIFLAKFNFHLLHTRSFDSVGWGKESRLSEQQEKLVVDSIVGLGEY